MRSQLLIFISTYLLSTLTVSSQEIINGSFESDSTPDCYVYYGLGDILTQYFVDDYEHLGLNMIDTYSADTDSIVFSAVGMCTDTNHYTGLDQLILEDGAVDGMKVLHLYADSTSGRLLKSGISFDLTSTLLKDTLYELSFYKNIRDNVPEEHEDYYRLPSDFAIGLSNDSSVFGTEIYYAQKAETVEWQFESFSFAPDSNYKFITVQTRLTEPYGQMEVFLDHFVLDQLVGIFEQNYNRFEVTPTLVEDQVRVSGVGIMGEELSIHNTRGELVRTERPTSDTQYIEISDLRPGVYLINIPGFKTRKIVKQ